MHNEDIMRTLDIHEDDMLYVEKGGEIIPKITGVEISERTPGAPPVSFVSHCPACGARLVRVEGEAAWVGIGEETAAALFALGFIRNVADLYDLTAMQLMTIEGFGAKSAERVIAGIEASKEVPFERVVFALSIPFVGETTARKVARAAKNIDTLMSMPTEQLEAIEDVGSRIAASIANFFADEQNKRMVERLRVAGLKMEVAVASESQPLSDTLAGKTFVISGVFAKHSREEYKSLIERHGGKNSGSISKKTDYVLAGENMGPAKLEKANKLGIPVISEDDFLRMTGE